MDRDERCDDLYSFLELIKKYRVKSDDVEELMREATEVAHRNGRSLNLVGKNLVAFINLDETGREINSKFSQLMDNLSKTNAFKLTFLRYGSFENLKSSELEYTIFL